MRQSPSPVHPSTADADPTTVARQQWLAELRLHPDPTVRRQALESWAEQPSADLDPLTYALVDEDDTVRTRAQELYTQQLAQEAAAAPGDAADAQHPHHAE